MIDLEFVNNFLFENFQNVSVSSNGTQFLARCALCGDSKKSKSKRRFNLKYKSSDSIYYHCFNCNESGSFSKLYRQITGENLRFNLEDEFTNVKDKFKKKEVKSWTKEQTYEIKAHNYILEDCISYDYQPSGFIDKKYHKVLLDFYKDRNISKNLKVFIAYKGYYKDRIIIPIYEKDRIIYFQARRIHNDMIPKYKNPKIEKSHLILNKHNFNKDKYIIITEGLLDAYSIGDQGTTCMGAELNADFIKNLSNLTDVGVILALDNDKQGMKSVKKFYKNEFLKLKNIKVRYFLIPHKFKKIKDINELSVVTKMSETDLYEFILRNSYSYEGYLTRSMLY